MNLTELKELCHSFSGVEKKAAGHPNNILVFSVHGKKFAYFKTSEPEQWRFSLRVTPERFLELTDQQGIKPARYMHRFHWVTIVNIQSMDKDYLKDLLTWSYHKALASLPKKIQSLYVAKKQQGDES